METLKEVLEKNKQKYIDRLSELVAAWKNKDRIIWRSSLERWERKSLWIP